MAEHPPGIGKTHFHQEPFLQPLLQTSREFAANAFGQITPRLDYHRPFYNSPVRLAGLIGIRPRVAGQVKAHGTFWKS